MKIEVYGPFNSRNIFGPHKIFAIHEYINKSIDFAAKFSNTKNGFPKEVSHH